MDVVIDLDEVICEMTKPLQKALEVETGKNIPVSEWHDYFLGEVYDIDKDTVFSVIEAHNVLWNAKPYLGAVEAMQTLRKRGFSIHIVTARSPFDSSGEKTARWLIEHEVPYDKLHISCHSRGKESIVRSICPVAMIDDHVKNIEDCYSSTYMSILINRPWNSNKDVELSQLVKRADSLQEAINLF